MKYVRKNYDFEPKAFGHYVSRVVYQTLSVRISNMSEIDTVPNGAVIFISCPAGMINAAYGGLMSTRAKASGAVGSIIDGRIRDLQEHRNLNFPVFAKAVGTPPPAEQVRVAEVNGTVRFQNEGMDVPIRAGDYIMGDLNGVVCLPKELAEKALDLIPSQLEADEKMAEDINDGSTFTDASKKYRTHVKQP